MRIRDILELAGDRYSISKPSLIGLIQAWCNPDTAKSHNTTCGRQKNKDGGKDAKNDKDVQEAIGKGKEMTPHRDGRPIPVTVDNVMDAVHHIEQGHTVEMRDAAQIHTLIDKIAYYNKECQDTGHQCKNLDLCQVSVKDTNVFCQHNKGVQRVNMPQFSGRPMPGSAADKLPRSKIEPDKVDASAEFIKHLQSKGIATQKVKVPAAWLRASQRELVGSKVARIMTSEKGAKLLKEPIFISRDNYIVDGHHRWAAAIGKDAASGHLGDLKMNANRIDAPISEVLHIANKWTKEFGLQSEGFVKSGEPKPKTAEQKRPQDQTYKPEALQKSLGPKMSHGQYLKSLRKNFGRSYDA
jgi:hypothetical protein